MFRRLSEPLPLSEASLLYFRPALNAPVLNVGYLPIGPARAAVVAFGEEYGGIGIALGVRSSESGQLAVLRNQESIDFDVPLAEALEPLLEQAERMGFLFDEDVLEESPGQAGRAQAMALWGDLMGGMERLIPPRAPERDARRGDEDDELVGPLSPSQAIEEMQYPELMLDDVAPFELADEPEDRPVLEETETLEPDLEPPVVAARTRDFEVGFDEPLEHGLDEALAGALDDFPDERLETDEGWEAEPPMRDDALLGESDLTEPTAPIAPVRTRAEQSSPPPAPAPAPAPVLASARPTVRPVAVPAVAPPSPPPVVPAAAVDSASPVAKAVKAPPRAVLSKFRNPEGLRAAARAGGASEVGADRSSELARIPIVRVRRERNPAKRVPLLARLLSSF